MYKLCAGVLILVAVFATGCKKTSTEGGITGNDTFRISVPALATAIKQGELQTVDLTLERGKGFQQSVKLEVKAPAGIKVEPNSLTIKPGDKGYVQLKISASKDAALGELKIYVRGAPDKGDPTETEFKITVNAN